MSMSESPMQKTPSSFKAPLCLMDPSGQPIFGQFDGPVASLGVEQFCYFNDMDKPASAWSKHFDFKQFQFVSIVCEHYIIGVALADIRYLGTAFCYLYDIKHNRLIESNWLKPFGMGYQIASSPTQGKAVISNNKGSIEFKIEQGQWHLKLDTLDIAADLTIVSEATSLPLAMCSPTGYNGWTYTQKHNGLKIEGKLSIANNEQDLQRATAGYDFSAGYMRRETSWRWASVNALTEDGSIGLNLAAGVNETGSTENAFWHNGKRHLLGPVRFDFTRQQGNEPSGEWHIYSDDGQIDLHFKSSNCRSEKLNLWLLKSNFRQYIGHFTGTIIDNSGIKHKLDNVMGLTEDHFAKW